jgi:hypothetical protein
MLLLVEFLCWDLTNNLCSKLFLSSEDLLVVHLLLAPVLAEIFLADLPLTPLGVFGGFPLYQPLA